MPLYLSDERLGHDVVREAIIRLPDGSLELLDGVSDDAYVLDRARNHRPEMRFRLTYDGPLKPAKSGKTRAQEKWEIRQQIAPQLAELWDLHPALLGHEMAYGGEGLIGGPPLESDEIASNRRQLTTPVVMSGYSFLPLVRPKLLLVCTLDILFLRKDPPGSVVSHGGDLDNRIKTLFDGLTMPKEQTEIDAARANGEMPDLPSPMHVLLENDRLVTAMTVRTDRLLSRPGAPKDEVRLVIDVIVSPTRIMIPGNSGFVAD